MERHFIVPFHRMPAFSPSSSSFLPRSRADLVARCIVSSLLVSGATRNDATLTACVAPDDASPLLLTACGAHVRGLQPDERTVLGLLHRALPSETCLRDVSSLAASGSLNSLAGPRACCAGFFVRPGGVSGAVRVLGGSGSGAAAVVVLDVAGEPAWTALPRLLARRPAALVVILGDDEGLTAADLAAIDTAVARPPSVPSSELVGSAIDGGSTFRGGVTRISLGPLPLLASACITLLHGVLDELSGPSPLDKRRRDEGGGDEDAPPPCPWCRPPEPACS